MVNYYCISIVPLLIAGTEIAAFRPSTQLANGKLATENLEAGNIVSIQDRDTLPTILLLQYYACQKKLHGECHNHRPSTRRVADTAEDSQEAQQI
jgi:hypothetical protein